jgi:hypothetical protein
MVRPPSVSGADHETVDLLSSPEVAETRTGADGTPVGVAAADAAELVPTSTQFSAATLNV